MHPGDNVYQLATYGPPSRRGWSYPTKPLVNECRRERKAEQRALGMTGKQYRKYLKKEKSQ